MATGLFLPFLALLITLVDMPDAAVAGDAAVLELMTRQTARGENLLGPYSRFHFNHPGPFYFFSMLPLYYFSGQAHGSFLFTATLINLVAVICIFLAIYRQPWLPFLSAATVLSLYLGHLGSETLYSEWNPNISILPFASSIFCFAAGVSGRWMFFFPALAMVSFAVQSHIAYTLSAVLITLGAFCLVLWPGLVGAASNRQKDCRLAMALSIFLLFLWFPTTYQELASEQGNLSRIVSFFRLGYEPKTIEVTIGVVAEQLTGMVSKSLDRPEEESSRHVWFGLLLLLGVASTYLFSRRRCAAISASLGLFCLVGLGGALLSVCRIVGPVPDYTVRWISSVTFFL